MGKAFRVATVLSLACVLLLGSAASAFAGTITVGLVSNATGVKSPSNPYLRAATVYVYGPSGYYGAQSSAASVWTPRNSFLTFRNCPDGPYRVRVVWSNRSESNRYPSLSWRQGRNPYVYFVSGL